MGEAFAAAVTALGKHFLTQQAHDALTGAATASVEHPVLHVPLTTPPEPILREPSDRVYPAMNENHNYRISSTYDRFENVTRVSVMAIGLPITSSPRPPLTGPLNLSAHFDFEGEAPERAVEEVILQIAVDTGADANGNRILWFERNHRCRVLVDGHQRTDLGDGHYEKYESGDSLFEVMQYRIQVELLFSIAAAQRVELRLGATECEMTMEHMAALGALAGWTTSAGFEQSLANTKRDAIRRTNTVGERYPDLAPLVAALERIRQECPDLWPDQADEVLATIPAGDSVAGLFYLNEPAPGVFVATQTQAMQVIAMEPMLISTAIPLSAVESMQFQQFDHTSAILTLSGNVKGEDTTIAAVIGEAAMNEATRVIRFVTSITGIKPDYTV